ncbi:MAG: polysaccharide deacetylase family protein [Candidatus Pelethousia sp.]|nr:polysaccharide deacetylase family protein [Candidatus Pelethousia sp.]
MIRRWVAVLTACFFCGNLLGCDGGAQIVQLEAPQSQPQAENGEPDSLTESVQDVAEAMLPAPLEDQEAVPADAPACVPNVDLSAPMVALTFDDGPLAGSTSRILDILEANGVRATFFVQGKQAAQYPELVQRAYGLGCQIGNHTYNHKDLTALNDQDALGQIESVNSLVAELTGEGCALVRPPHGRGWRDERVLNLVPYPLILWSIDTNDWSTLNPEKTIFAVLDSVKDGDIVLMHDVYSETADAVETIIPELIARGYQLVTVSEMFEYKGLELSPGHAYRHAG